MVKKLLLSIALFSTVCSLVNSIYLHTKSHKNEYCMQKTIDGDDNSRVSYLITGDSDEEKVDARLFDPNNNQIFERTGESGGEYQHKSTEGGIYKLCFYVPNPGNNYISFEYFTDYEKGHTLDMAKDRNNLNFSTLIQFHIFKSQLNKTQKAFSYFVE